MRVVVVVVVCRRPLVGTWWSVVVRALSVIGRRSSVVGVEHARAARADEPF